MKPTPTEKIAIVCSGGGMRCAYSAGVLYALATKIGITTPSIIIGSSGNAGNVLYFSAKQYGKLREFWEDIVSDSRFISLFRRQIMDVDYLIDTLLKQKMPLDTHALKHTKTTYFIPVVNVKDGSITYFGNHEDIDAYELLRAAKAVPIFFNEEVYIKGKPYIDGDVGSALDHHVTKAKQSGARKILAINVDENAGWFYRIAISVYAFFMPRALRDSILHDIYSDVTEFTLPEGTDGLVLTPKKLPLHMLTRSKRKIRKGFALGYHDTLEREKEIRALFGV